MADPTKEIVAANDNSRLRYATTCSGIECASLAFEPLGMTPVFFSEIEPFPKAVLAHRWPHVPDLGDLNGIDGREWRGKVDVFWGSPPCQTYSSIGRRAGRADPRGELSFKFVEVANDMDPNTIIIENSKGLISNAKAFHALLCDLSGEDDGSVTPKFGNEGVRHGPRRNVSWRVLDALDFGLPQHRERVFVVATARTSGIDPARVLSVGGSSQRNYYPRRKDRTHHPAANDGGAAWFVNGDTRPKIRCEETATLRAQAQHAFVVQDGRIRRLTAREWERLQGIPDDHTLIEFEGADATPAQRKKAVGNGLAVPVVRWIGKRLIEQVAANDHAEGGQ